MKILTDFTKDKAMHSLGVANFMRVWAHKLNLDENKAWLIGYIHDIGYMIESNNHSYHGKELMAPYSQELSYFIGKHDTSEPIKDNMEFLLRVADLTIDHEGRYVGMEVRRNSICMRDGNKVHAILDEQIRNIKDYAEKHGFTEIIEVCK